MAGCCKPSHISGHCAALPASPLSAPAGPRGCCPASSCVPLTQAAHAAAPNLHPSPAPTRCPQALRRLRLPLFFDSTAWVVPAGALTHLMITIPFWTR